MLSASPSTYSAIPSTRRGMGLTLLTHTRNSSKLARELYLAPYAVPHTMLSGNAADTLSASPSIALKSYLYIELRWREHRRWLALSEEPLPYPSGGEESNSDAIAPGVPLEELPRGTVGTTVGTALYEDVCVTSTGGRTNKLVGRIVDTLSMDSGFWAEKWLLHGWLRRTWHRVCGCGTKVVMGGIGTGDGDYFKRLATASTIERRMQCSGECLDEAASQCVEGLRQDGGIGGVVCLGKYDHVTMRMN